MPKHDASSLSLPAAATGIVASPDLGSPAAHGSLARALSTTRGRIVAVLLGSAFVALCAHAAVPLPWTPVPMTMQPFAVLLVALLIGPWLGAAAMVAYLVEGAAGLPVFVPGYGGLLPLAASSGYLLSYPLVAVVTGLIAGRGRGLVRALAGAAAGDAFILFCGAAWLAAITHSGPALTARLAVLPFVAGDAVKVVLAALLAAGATRLLRPSRPTAAR